ncbi:MAG: hypothetical protein E7655_06315 [Ruminococcaceae bacterium]|nr:hypothetical protein [Oscillospiraceae bacterium]
MGFGLLFLGYLFLFDFPYKGLDIFPDAAGFAIMLLGLLTLVEYERSFRRPLYAGFCLLILNAADLALQLATFFGADVPAAVNDVFTYLLLAGLLCYNILLFTAVRTIATETGLPSLRVRAVRNIIFTIALFAIKVFFSLDFTFIREMSIRLNEAVHFASVLFLLDWAILFLNALLLFSCYMRICKEGDEDMPMPEKSQKTKNNKKEG